MSDAIILPNPDSMIHKAFAESGKLMDTTINWLKHRNPYPFDARIEYLESTGTQWIDTGVVPTTEDSIHVNTDIALTEINTSDNNILFGSFESRSGVASRLFAFVDSSSHPRIAYGAAASSSVTVQANQRLSITADFAQNSQTLSVNGSVASSATNTTTFLPAVNMAIFCSNYPSGIVSPSKMRLWSFKLLLNGALVRDFIPVRIGQVGYLYDKVSGELFGNAGTGSFVLGPDIVPIEYLESSGTQWIDALVTPDGNTELDSEWTIPATSSGTLCGGRESSSSGQYFVWAFPNHTNPNQAWRFGYGTTGAYFGPASAYTTPMRVKFGPGYANFGTATKTFTSQTFTASATKFYIFALCNGASSSSDRKPLKLHWLKISQSNSIVRDFIPVRLGTTGYLLDKVSNKLFANSGSGDFILGPDL